MDSKKTAEQIEKRSQFVPGLEGVVAAQTRLSHVDGQAGELLIAGYPVEVIAGRFTFEELVYLLWYGDWPDAGQLAGFQERLAAKRALPEIIIELLSTAAAQKMPAMNALRMAAGMVDLDWAAGEQGGDLLEQGHVVLARLPVIVASYWRLLNGQEPVDPRPDLGFAANYLYMLNGVQPEKERARGLETYLNTVIDHGLNASTFTARVIVSTGSDLVSAVVGAIGALKGPLHGGAPGPALDTVFEIGEASRAEAVLRAKLERKERLMGFGHRVYRVRDPRADVLAEAAESFYRQAGDLHLYELARQVEQTALRLLAEYVPGRDLQTNVEFYTALLLHGLGLPTDLFTPTFTISRAAGWIAHSQEQRRQNRLIRPQSEYIGEKRTLRTNDPGT